MCSHHPKKEVELVCKQDSELICVICVATLHHGHMCQTLEESYMAKEKEIHGLVSEAKEMGKKLKESLDNTNKEKEKEHKNKQTHLAEIDLYFTMVFIFEWLKFITKSYRWRRKLSKKELL